MSSSEILIDQTLSKTTWEFAGEFHFHFVTVFDENSKKNPLRTLRLKLKKCQNLTRIQNGLWFWYPEFQRSKI